MALENAESLSDPLKLDAPKEPVPDSSPLRVSRNTHLESGIPPARRREPSDALSALDRGLTLEDGAERMEAALANVARTEANLGLLVRGLKHLALGAQAARAANVDLMDELDELRAHLTRSHEEEHAMRFRMSQLEQMLDVIRHETARQRAFLIEEQDRFLLEIMTDHDREIAELRVRLRESCQNKVDARQLDELVAQRDQAREYATRCERERDLAWQELATAAATVATESLTRSKSGSTAIGAVSLRAVTVPASRGIPDLERPSERPATGYSLSREDLDE